MCGRTAARTGHCWPSWNLIILSVDTVFITDIIKIYT